MTKATIKVEEYLTHNPVPYPTVRAGPYEWKGNENGEVEVEYDESWYMNFDGNVYVGATGYNTEDFHRSLLRGGSVNLKKSTGDYIYGHIIDCDTREKIAGAKVEWFTKSATTNENGFYKLLNPQTGSGSIRVSKEGYETTEKQIEYGGGGYEVSTCLTKIPKPKIYGYVKDQDGNPIEGAKVSSGGINPTYTNSGGYYEYSTDPAVSIRIDVEKEGYNSISEWVDVGTEDVRKDFVLTKEEEAPPEENHNRIYGIVKDKALGTPINLATVTFGGKTAYTGNNGKYEIKDVFYSGQIVCSATGYNAATKFIEAPTEGDLEVNFELERSEAPQIDISPIAPPLQGMDKELSAANEIAKQQLDAAKTQGEIPEPAIETALRQVGLDDWADKYHEIYEWLNDNFGIEVPDPHDPTKKRKVIILTAGFAGGLGGLASKLGLNTAKGALTRAGGAIAATIGGLKASSILKGITGIVGTVVFAEFICEEAVQTAGMGVYMASQTRDPEVVRQALENYKNILNATKQIHDTVKYIDPIGSTFEAFFVAAENNITNYENLISRLEEKKERQMTKTDILRAYREELIDEDTAKEKLRALNYSDEDIDVMLNLTAKEKLGKLRVTSKPTHAQIIINDNPVDLLTSETMELPPGTYAVTVSLEGYKIPDAKEVTIEEEGRAEVHFDLERMKIGYLHIRSRPSQAAIYINGVDTKLLTPQKFELEEGTYTITLKYKGYEDREIEVDIKENETVERFVRLVRKT